MGSHPHQPLLLQQVGGLFPLPAVLVLQLLEPARAGRGGHRVDVMQGGHEGRVGELDDDRM